MGREGYFIVSIHDASPAFSSELKELVSELDSHGIVPRSVLVIPNYQERYNILKDDRFLSWIQSLQEGGDEIVHHGYNHLAGEGKHSSFNNYLYDRLFAKGCGEFQYLDYREAEDKIRLGKEIFHRAGIDCQGFVAPGWLMSQEAERVLVAEGYLYATFIKIFRDYGRGRDVESEVVRFISRPKLQDYLYRLYDFYLIKIKEKREKLIRVALHPSDVRFGKPFKYALRLIGQLKKYRTPLTYLDFTKTLV
ncbi:DUF2334 domain-containing protein [Candidatus Aerophobetes bacterium]|uniref:DUF2334 domain-containing protein n=1 Tax=Aerophobetes bacterium TaxID=2030807 RepID=A0A523TBB8_UNCAE|nr:MAG: DUF2334 domain-containing protein [Candidatus Aerophobetes bacterium]